MPDVQVLRVGKGDVCLTLTSGGCNAINMCLQGAASVTAVDCNPAQSALLELKAIAIRCATSCEKPDDLAAESLD